MGVLTVWFTGTHESGCPIGFDGKSMKFETDRRAGMRAVKALRYRRPVLIVESNGEVSMLSAETTAAVTLATWAEGD